MNKKEKFVKLPRDLIRSRQYRLVGPSARDLYVWMLDSMYDDGNINTSPAKIRYGPKSAEQMGMSRATYYRSIDKLLHYGIAVEIESNGHGKDSIYDLTAWRWKNGE